MKLLTAISVGFFMLSGLVAAQGPWDVDQDRAPSTSQSKPLPRPTRVEPFTFIFYQKCRSADDPMKHSGEWGFDIVSHYGLVCFDHDESDSLVIMKLKLEGDGSRESRIWFPREPFTLKVRLGMDSAVFRLDLTTGVCEYLIKSDLLKLGKPKELPDTLIWIQFMGWRAEHVKSILAQLHSTFGQAIERVVLEEGYYPCLPAPLVNRARIARRILVNDDSVGYLVCVDVVDRSHSAAVVRWISDKQKEEFSQSDSQVGTKGK